MQNNDILRHTIGYMVGTTVFLLLIPYLIWQVSLIDHVIFKTQILHNSEISFFVAMPFFAIGVLFVIWSNLFLVSEGKGGPTDIAGITISPRSKQLVTTGPYKYTRNPMAFGTNSIYLAIAIYLNSVGCLIATVLFFLVIVKGVVASEEQRLLKDFGDEYLEYRKKTSMIIPLPPR